MLHGAASRPWPRPLGARLWCALVLHAIATPLHAQLPESALSVRGEAGSLVWWRADHAPIRWPAGRPELTGAVRWRELSGGIEAGRLDFSGDGVDWRITVVLARLDPKHLRVELQT